MAKYGASSERYSTVDIRFTLSDGEPEPTQFDTKVYVDELTSIKLDGRWVLIKLVR